jgi:hypothetical protein
MGPGDCGVHCTGVRAAAQGLSAADGTGRELGRPKLRRARIRLHPARDRECSDRGLFRLLPAQEREGVGRWTRGCRSRVRLHEDATRSIRPNQDVRHGANHGCEASANPDVHQELRQRLFTNPGKLHLVRERRGETGGPEDAGIHVTDTRAVSGRPPKAESLLSARSQQLVDPGVRRCRSLSGLTVCAAGHGRRPSSCPATSSDR